MIIVKYITIKSALDSLLMLSMSPLDLDTGGWLVVKGSDWITMMDMAEIKAGIQADINDNPDNSWQPSGLYAATVKP